MTDRLMNARRLNTPLALRPREAAELLAVSPRTLWAWTKAGLIPHLRVGTGRRKTVLYPLADVQEWLAAQAVATKGVQA